MPVSLLATATVMPLVLPYGSQKPTMLYQEYSGGMNTMPNMITQAAGTVNRRAKSRLRTFRMLPTDTPGACCWITAFLVAIR